jgi:hypothetical protein
VFPRRKNLLEAFKSSSAPGAAPKVSPAPAEASAPRPTLFDAPSAGQRVSGRPGVSASLAGFGLVLAFALGFLAGRTTQSAHAEEPKAPALEPARPVNQPRSFQSPPAPQFSPPNEPASLETSALADPKNLQTVVVASYTKTKSDLAWATYQHLKDANLPVFPPVETRNLLVVLAGAAPTSEELAKTLAGVRALARDGKKKDYEDAYCARIDTLIPRPKKGTENP